MVSWAALPGRGLAAWSARVRPQAHRSLDLYVVNVWRRLNRRAVAGVLPEWGDTKALPPRALCRMRGCALPLLHPTVRRPFPLGTDAHAVPRPASRPHQAV